MCYMFSVEREVPAPPAEVWRLVSDVSRWPEFLPTIDAVELLGESGVVGVGSKFRVRQPGLPSAVYSVTEWHEGRGFTWEARSGGVRTIATHTITALGTGSHVELSIDWKGALAGLIGMVYGKRAGRMVNTEADTFARLATSG